MVRHFNPTISQNALRILNTKGFNLDEEVSGLVAVIPITSIPRIVRGTSRTTTGNSTIYTTPSDKDFYLTGFYISATADVASDCVLYNFQITVDGVSQRIFSMVKTTLTAFNQTQFVALPIPIKIDRGTAITIGQSFTVGTSTVASAIYGYTEETTTS